MATDDRLGIVVGSAGQAAPGDSVVEIGSAELRGHGSDCACCQPRGALAEALLRVHLDYARGASARPGRVLVAWADANGRDIPDGLDRVAAALGQHVMLRARFRLDGPA